MAMEGLFSLLSSSDDSKKDTERRYTVDDNAFSLNHISLRFRVILWWSSFNRRQSYEKAAFNTRHRLWICAHWGFFCCRIVDSSMTCQTWCHCLCVTAWCIAWFIFVGTLRDEDRRHPLNGRSKCIWTTAGFCFEIRKDEKSLDVAPKALLPFYVCSVHMHAHLFVVFIFLSPSFIALRATRLCL